MLNTKLNNSLFKNNTLHNSEPNYALSSGYTNLTTINGERSLLTDEELALITLINSWGLGQCVVILGMIVNVLNVITFVKQGVKDSVNISLLGLTISDLGSLLFHFLGNIFMTPSFMNADLPFYPKQSTYIPGYGHILCTKITAGITAWITFERCVCIVAPLKIKSIVTPRRTVIVIALIYFIMMAITFPIFYTTRLTWIFVAARNRSILFITKIPATENIEGLTYWTYNLMPTFFFVLIVIFTTLLVMSLRKKSKWREQSTSSMKGNVKSNRDTKVAKIVVIISSVFIFCYLPSDILHIFVAINPSIRFSGNQTNFRIGIFTIVFHLESINASVNFFIYLNMSSKFKATLREILCLNKSNESKSNAI